MVKISFELDGELIDVQLAAPCGVGEFIDVALEVLSYMENFDGLTDEQLVPGYKDLAKTARSETERFQYVCAKLNLREFAILYRDGLTFRNDAPFTTDKPDVPDWNYIQYLLAIICEFRGRVDSSEYLQSKGDELDRMFLNWLWGYCDAVGECNTDVACLATQCLKIGDFLDKTLKTPKKIVDMFFRAKFIETTETSGGLFDDSLSFNIRTNSHEYRVLMVSSILRIRTIESGHSFDIDVLKMDDEELIEEMLPGLSEFTGCREVIGLAPSEKLDCILQWVRDREFYREFHVWNEAGNSYERQSIPRGINVGYKELACAEEKITAICNGKDIHIFVYLAWVKREYGNSATELLNSMSSNYLNEFQESYKGAYETLREFARMAVTHGTLSIPGDSGEVRQSLLAFIDWEKVYATMLECGMVMHISLNGVQHVFIKRGYLPTITEPKA